jgi:hypothetical protein
MTKVAVGCAEIDTLEQRLTGRAANGETYVVTRFKPKQADALIGGSLYWIVKHRLVARSEILGFEDDPDGRRIRIRLAERLVPIRAIPKRAHQGWRYLPESDAPADLFGDEAEGLASLPAPMAAELAALALI